jgi:outer membrane protein assembly factor BamB/TolB-like protein
MKISFAALSLLFLLTFSNQAQQANPLKSVAVLKFENRSALAENEWLGLGFAETITTKLGLIDGLSLMERTKLYDVLLAAGRQENLDESKESAGEEYRSLLGVDYLLIGSVQTTKIYTDETSQLKINARIIKTSSAQISGELSFSVSGNIKDIFRLETDLAAKFCETLGVTARLVDLSFEDAQSLLAQQLYGEGLKSYYAGDYPKAIELFRDAVNKNEGVFYAAAHTMEGYARQKQIDHAKDTDRQNLKDQYVEQFRKDAGEAAPAFYDLGIAEQAIGNYSHAIKSFRQFIMYLGESSKLYSEKGFDDFEPDTSVMNLYGFSDRAYRPTCRKEFYYAKNDKQIERIDYSTGTKRWAIPMPMPFAPDYTHLTLAGNTLFVQCERVQAYDNRTGKLLWEFPKNPFFVGDGFAILSNIVVEGPHVFAAVPAMGKVFTLDRNTGQLIAQFSLPAGIWIDVLKVKNGILDISEMVVDPVSKKWIDKKQFVNLSALYRTKKSFSEIDALYQIGRSLQLALSFDSALVYLDQVIDARNDYIPAIESKAEIYYALGKYWEANLWVQKAYRISVPQRIRDLAFQLNGLKYYQRNYGVLFNVHTEGNHAYLGLGSASKTNAVYSAIQKIDLSGYSQTWKYVFDLPNNYNPHFAADDKAVYFYEPYRTTIKKNVEDLWSEPVFWNYQLKALSADSGKVLWIRKFEDHYYPMLYYDELVRPAVLGSTVYASFQQGNLYAVDRNSGVVQWRTNTVFEPNAKTDPISFYGEYKYSGNVAAGGGRIYIPTGNKLKCYSLDGKPLWDRTYWDGEIFSLRYDSEQDLIFFAGGNTYDAKTGELIDSTYQRFDPVYPQKEESVVYRGYRYQIEYQPGLKFSKTNLANKSVQSAVYNVEGSDARIVPLGDDEMFILLGRPYDEGTGVVLSVDPKTLNLQWRYDTTPPVSHVHRYDNTYYLFLRDASIIAIDRAQIFKSIANGKKWWE